MREPLFHSTITDALPDDHTYAHSSADCRMCGELVHAANNECMKAWFETGIGIMCAECFLEKYNAFDEDEDRLGLP